MRAHGAHLFASMEVRHGSGTDSGAADLVPDRTGGSISRAVFPVPKTAPRSAQSSRHSISFRRMDIQITTKKSEGLERLLEVRFRSKR